jgi:hypothetical protein
MLYIYMYVYVGRYSNQADVAAAYVVQIRQIRIRLMLE